MKMRPAAMRKQVFKEKIFSLTFFIQTFCLLSTKETVIFPLLFGSIFNIKLVKERDLKYCLTHFRLMFHLCRNQLVGFYWQNV